MYQKVLFDPIDNSLDRPINEILNGIPRTLPNFIEKVFQLPKKTNPIYDTWKEVVDCFNAALSRIRNSKNELAEWKKTWHNRNALTKKVTFPCAGTLQKFCIAFISNNETMKMESKEWLDVYHLIVPVAYAKFVLIDSRWTNFISQLGLNPPLIARTYNSTNKDQFLKEISAY